MKGSWPLKVLMASPLLLLGLDFAVHPFFLSTSTAEPSLKSSELLATRRVYLGRFHQHPVSVSLADLRSAEYYPDLVGERVGLAISHFVGEDSAASRMGSLGQTLIARLSESSPLEARSMATALRSAAGHRAGEVLEVPVDLEAEARASFPVTAVLVVLLEQEAGGEENRAAIATALTSASRRAREMQLDHLVLPCLAVRPGGDPREFAVFFEGALAGLEAAPSKVWIDFSLFDGWRSATLETAIRSLEEQWQISVREAGELPARLQSWRYRLILLFLSICLFTCPAAIDLDGRKVVTIAIAFLVLVNTLQGLTSFLLQGRSGWTLFWIDLVITAACALFLPFFSRVIGSAFEDLMKEKDKVVPP